VNQLLAPYFAWNTDTLSSKLKRQSTWKTSATKY
jgi:hypothetical protein